MTYISPQAMQKILEDMAPIPAKPAQRPTTKSIVVRRIGQLATIDILDKEAWKEFQELIQRGSNLWPDASPQIKEFADIITNGKVLQDYFAQAGISQTDVTDTTNL